MDYERGFGDLGVLVGAARALGPVLDRVFVIISADQLLARAAKVRAITKANSMLIVVDYRQKLAMPAMDRRLQVSAASSACRKLAATLNAPVLAISSMNRDAYRDGQRTNTTAGQAMASLKENGDVEYDADAVLLPTRGEESTWNLRLVKNRHGIDGLTFVLARHGVSGQIAESDARHEELVGGRRRA